MDNLVKVEKIFQFLNSKKLTQTQFCKMCGIEKRQLKNMLLGKNTYNVETLFKVGKFIGVEVKDLINK